MESAEALTQDDPAKAGGGEARRCEPDDGGEARPAFAWSADVGSVALGFGRDSEPTALDWAGRGRLDLLVTAEVAPGARAARLYLRSEDAALRFEPGVERPELGGLRCLCPMPNGRPSRFDLVGLGEAGLVWLPNEGTAESPRFEARRGLGLPADLGLGPGRVAQVLAADWDGDGRVDLLIGFDGLEGYWPEGRAVPTAQQVGFNQRAGHPGYDGSGRWRGRAPRPRIVWLRNEGPPGEPRFAAPEDLDAEAPIRLASRPAPMLVAWSGRGGWEFLLGDAQGEVRRHRNFGGQRPPVLMEPHLLHLRGQPLSLPDDRTILVPADLDGDHREELLYGRADGRVFAVRAGSHRDEVREPEPIPTRPASVWLGGGAVVAAADLDGDGDLDLVVGDASGRLHLLRDRGTASAHAYDPPAPLEAGGEPFRLDPGPDGVLGGPVAPRLGYACPALVDWNANGRLDLLVGGAGGEVLYLRNNGSPRDPRYDAPRSVKLGGSPLFTPPRVRPAAADWLGTGRVDLISLDLQGFLCVYPRSGTLEVGDPVPLVDRLGRLLRLDGGFGLAGRCALWAGPFLEPGRIDLLVGLPADARFVVPALTGQSAATIDAFPTVLILENAGRNALIPRPIRLADGRPLVVGYGGCSPCGVAAGDGGMGLLVGTDEGELAYYPRSELRW